MYANLHRIVAVFLHRGSFRMLFRRDIACIEASAFMSSLLVRQRRWHTRRDAAAGAPFISPNPEGLKMPHKPISRDPRHGIGMASVTVRDAS
jgi:hypothetical protein